MDDVSQPNGGKATFCTATCRARFAPTGGYHPPLLWQVIAPTFRGAGSPQQRAGSNDLVGSITQEGGGGMFYVLDIFKNLEICI